MLKQFELLCPTGLNTFSEDTNVPLWFHYTGNLFRWAKGKSFLATELKAWTSSPRTTSPPVQTARRIPHLFWMEEAFKSPAGRPPKVQICGANINQDVKEVAAPSRHRTFWPLDATVETRLVLDPAYPKRNKKNGKIRFGQPYS